MPDGYKGQLPTITCKYSCPECGLERIEVQVPVRTTQDVVAWIEKVCLYILAADHNSRSPHCTPAELKDLMIPVTGADKIGGPQLT